MQCTRNVTDHIIWVGANDRRVNLFENLFPIPRGVSEGSASYEKRKELFETRKSAVETEIQELQKTLSLLKFKCWYYETAMKDGNEDAINAMLPDKLPKNIQKLYDKGHD